MIKQPSYIQRLQDRGTMPSVTLPDNIARKFAAFLLANGTGKVTIHVTSGRVTGSEFSESVRADLTTAE